jgi:hypothetical protein
MTAFYYTRSGSFSSGTFTASTAGVWDITVQGAAGGAADDGGAGGYGSNWNSRLRTWLA